MHYTFYFLVGIAACSVLAGSAYAQTTCSWSGGSGDWETEEGWSCGAVPGPGDTVVVATGAIVALQSNAEVAVLVVSGSHLVGPGDLVVTDSMLWRGGRVGAPSALSGTGALRMGAGARLRIEQSNNNDLYLKLDRTIESSGVTTWSSGIVLPESGGTFVNRPGATFRATDLAWNFHAAFRNETGAQFIYDRVGSSLFGNEPSGFPPPDDPAKKPFINEGEVTVVRGGMGLLGPATAGGRVTVNEGAMLQFRGHGPYLVSGLVDSRGIVSMRSGFGGSGYLHGMRNEGTWRTGSTPDTLIVPGFSLDAGGTLELKLSGTEPGTEFDQLWSPDEFITLNGDLEVTFSDGFLPQAGDSFAVAIAGEPGRLQRIDGLFRRRTGLVDEARDLALWPRSTFGTLWLKAEEGVPVLDPVVTLDHDDDGPLTRGSVSTLFIFGQGFAPDVEVRLVCRTCYNPDDFAEVDAVIWRLERERVDVKLDLTPAELWGEYDVVVEDSRGGRAVAPLTILPGGLTVTVDVLNPEVEEGDAATFRIRTNQPVDARVRVPFEVGGTASQYLDYVVDLPARVVEFAPGRNEIRVRALTLRDNVADGGETTSLQLPEGFGYTLASPTVAVAAISDGPAPDHLALYVATPGRGGNSGTVTVRVAAQGLESGAAARLVRGGDVIEGRLSSVSETGTILTTVFDLTGRATGVWDVDVLNGDGELATLPAGFTVEQTRRVRLWTDVTGPNVFRPSGSAQRYVVTVTNSGNTDAYLVPVWIAVDRENDVGLLAPMAHVELMEGWEDVPVVLTTEDELVMPLILPVVPAGSSVSVPFAARGHRIRTWTTRPLVEGFPDAEALGELAKRLSVAAALSGDARSGSAAIGTPAGGCVLAIFQTVFDVTLDLIPGAGCVESIAKALEQQLVNSIGAANSVAGGDGVGIGISGASFLSSLLGVVLGCTTSVIPGSQVIQVAADLVVGVANIVNSCSWPDPEGNETTNPFVRAEPNEMNVDEIMAVDPNDKLGPDGAGPDHFVAAADPFGYLIRFENKSEATAAALEVLVSDRLDSTSFDLSTFALGPITFGERTVVPPPGLKTFSSSVDLEESGLRVLIHATLDEDGGEALWRFATLDAATGELPTDPTAGFLPPNVNSPEGEGSVFFTVQPRTEVSTGREVRNDARIVFDLNEPIDTPVWSNRIDREPPVSAVLPLNAVQSDSAFVVAWEGSDTGAGVASYTIYVSRDGGPYEVWLAHTTEMEARFVADSTHQDLAFYSVAVDGVGYQEAAPESPDATTAVVVGVEELENDLPTEFSLKPAYPNPFNPETVIAFDLPRTSDVRLAVYDVLGREVAVLLHEEKPAGRYLHTWRPVGLASGLYFYRIRAEHFEDTRRVVLVK